MQIVEITVTSARDMKQLQLHRTQCNHNNTVWFAVRETVLTVLGWCPPATFHYLHQGGYVFRRCSTVCLFVSNFVQKLSNGFA